MSTSLLNIAPATTSEPATPRLSTPRRTAIADSSERRADSAREKDAVSFHELVERSAGRPATNSSSEKPDGEATDKVPSADSSEKKDTTSTDTINASAIVSIDPTLAAAIAQFDRSQQIPSALITDMSLSPSTTGGIAIEAQLTAASIGASHEGRPVGGTTLAESDESIISTVTTDPANPLQADLAAPQLANQTPTTVDDGALLDGGTVELSAAGELASVQTDAEIPAFQKDERLAAQDSTVTSLVSGTDHSAVTTASTVTAASETVAIKPQTGPNDRKFPNANTGIESEVAVDAERATASDEVLGSHQTAKTSTGNEVAPESSLPLANVGDRAPETEGNDTPINQMSEIKGDGTTQESPQFTSQLNVTGSTLHQTASATREMSQSAAHSLTQRITQQISETIVTRATTTEVGDSITLNAVLDPPDLGRLHVRLTRSDSGLKAIVSAENGDVHQVITEHSASIERMVRTQLKSNESMQFLTSDTPNHHGSASQHGYEQPQRTARFRNGVTSPNETVDSPRPLRSTRSEIDVLA